MGRCTAGHLYKSAEKELSKINRVTNERNNKFTDLRLQIYFTPAHVTKSIYKRDPYHS